MYTPRFDISGLDFESVIESINSEKLDDSSIKFFSGYTGWSYDQLTDEIKNDSWIIANNDDNIEFNKDSKKSINPILLVMPWIIFLQFMQNFNENVFYLITPNIAETFGISPATVSWIVSVAGFSFISVMTFGLSTAA